MRPDVISETVRLWEEQPDKAKSKPTVKALSDGSDAVMEAGPFLWHSDLPEPIGGTNQAPSPTALLLSALAGCAVVFIRDTLAPQFGVRVDMVGRLHSVKQIPAAFWGWTMSRRTYRTFAWTSGCSLPTAKAMSSSFTRLGRSAARFIWPSPRR
jgi:hypothetical protein